jgi:Bacterial transcriptional activator domain
LVHSGTAQLSRGAYAKAAAELTQALGLWRGPVLADIADYDFVRPVADHLIELRIGAVEARIDADLVLGRHASVVAELAELTGDHPLRERLHGRLIVALYRCGRQAEALGAYRHLRDVLSEDLALRRARNCEACISGSWLTIRSWAGGRPATGWTPPHHRTQRPRTPRPGSRPATSRWSDLGVTRVDGGWSRRRGGHSRGRCGGTGHGVARQSPRSTLAALPANSVGVMAPDGSLRVAAPVCAMTQFLSCGAFSRADPNSVNVAEYCNPACRRPRSSGPCDTADRSGRGPCALGRRRSSDH